MMHYMVNKTPTLAPAAAKAIAAWEAADEKHEWSSQEIANDRIDNLSDTASWTPADGGADLIFQICSLHSILSTAESVDEGEWIREKSMRAARRLIVLIAQSVEGSLGTDRSALGFDFMMDPKLDAKHFAGAIG